MPHSAWSKKNRGFAVSCVARCSFLWLSLPRTTKRQLATIDGTSCCQQVPGCCSRGHKVFGAVRQKGLQVVCWYICKRRIRRFAGWVSHGVMASRRKQKQIKLPTLSLPSGLIITPQTSMYDCLRKRMAVTRCDSFCDTALSGRLL